MINQDSHIIAVFSEPDFEEIRNSMREWEWIRSVTFDEYNYTVEKSLEMAKSQGLKPTTFTIGASEFLAWCMRGSRDPSPSEETLRDYIIEYHNNNG